MNPRRDSFLESRYSREIPTPWPKPVPVRITLRDCWEIVGLTLVAGLSILVLPFAVLVLMEAAR